MYVKRLLICLLLLVNTASLAQAKKDAKSVYGLIENIKLLPYEIKLRAKLDTGAKTSSLDARDIELYDRNGQQWVKFHLFIKPSNSIQTFHYKVERFAKIKNRWQEKDSTAAETMRPVIKLPVCIGSQRKLIEVNLQNRQNFLYHFLLGRDALKSFNIIVDPQRKFQSKLICR